MTLSDLRPGQRGWVLELRCAPELKRRLEDLGLTPGQELWCLHRAPFGSPAAYEVLGAAIALRKSEAAGVVLEDRAP